MTRQSLEAEMGKQLADFGGKVLKDQATTTRRIAKAKTALLKTVDLYVEERERLARIDENESIEYVLQSEIDEPDHCYLHDKYVSQCHACKTKKWRAIFCKEELKILRERLATLRQQDKENINE